MYKHSVAMTDFVHAELEDHLLRRDGQEDICLVTYSVSTGLSRTTRLLHTVHLPRRGDRLVHGNATINGSYVLRIATTAAQFGHGVAILHSHPGGRGWQGLSGPDADAEQSYSSLVEQITGSPLIGLTLAGDRTWSARVWINCNPVWVGSVRRVGTNLRISWNDKIVAPASGQATQVRTISAWGSRLHRDITRLRVLVVGAGSVGLDIIQRLAATGIVEIGIMDFDRIEQLNLDRMVGATRRDARLRRRKIDIAARLARTAATASAFKVHRHNANICTAEGVAAALDYDIIISCVDRPWPRAVLNSIAYADLIPVIDGGIAIDAMPNGGMRGSTRRTQTATPGRPCLACAGQIDMTEVRMEMNGELDDPEYIRQADREPISGRPNVAALCGGVSASQLENFVSLVARPGGEGVPAPLRFNLALHHLEHMQCITQSYCDTESRTAEGDGRADLSCATDKPMSDPGDGLSGVRRWFEDSIDRVIERFWNR